MENLNVLYINDDGRVVCDAGSLRRTLADATRSACRAWGHHTIVRRIVTRDHTWETYRTVRVCLRVL